MTSRIVYTSRDEKRPRKKKKWNAKAVFFAGSAALVLAGAAWALYYPAWHIAAVEVLGNETISEAEIKEAVARSISGNYAAIFPKRSFFVVSSNSLESGFRREFPQIKRVVVEKIFPDRMKVSIEERVLWGIACNDLLDEETSDCVYIDTTGFGIEHSPASVGSLILKIKTDAAVLEPGTQLIAEKLAETMFSVAEGVEKVAGSDVVGFEIPTRVLGELRAETREGFKIFFDINQDLGAQFGVLKTVLANEIKEKRSSLLYIDLRFGNKVFYKLQ